MYRTHSRLAMDKNTVALVELGFNERDRGDNVVQDVLSFHVVDFNMFVGEGLPVRCGSGSQRLGGKH